MEFPSLNAVQYTPLQKSIALLLIWCLLSFSFSLWNHGKSQYCFLNSAKIDDDFTLGEVQIIDEWSPLQLESVLLTDSQYNKEEKNTFFQDEWIYFRIQSNYIKDENHSAFVYAVPHGKEVQMKCGRVDCAFEYNFDDGDTSEQKIVRFKDYIHHQFWESGYYDLLFTYDETVVACIVIKILPVKPA